MDKPYTDIGNFKQVLLRGAVLHTSDLLRGAQTLHVMMTTNESPMLCLAALSI